MIFHHIVKYTYVYVCIVLSLKYLKNVREIVPTSRYIVTLIERTCKIFEKNAILSHTL